ncbi:MAG: endonuclease [Candidatus Omnitrophica bacterium]|nr:endonuclease [Candidatus Omnitrophota bacterium]
MDTKLKADIAESAVTTELLRRGFKVLKPIGDRLPYDLAIDADSKLIKIQVKSAWFYKGAYKADSRMTKTNRRKIIRKYYDKNDFDFAIIYIQDLNIFYIMPQETFSGYKSEISLVETAKRQRRPKSIKYRERWDLFLAASISSDFLLT